MGYESKLYVVDKIGILPHNGKGYCRKIAMFDLCNCGQRLASKFYNSPEASVYFFDDSGEKEVLHDCYGKPLTEMSIEFVIEALQSEISDGETYRRLFPVLATLKVIKEQKNRDIWDDDIVVLHYGH